MQIGNAIIGREGILEMILAMANSEDELHQKVACECIIAAASKQDKAKAIITQVYILFVFIYEASQFNFWYVSVKTCSSIEPQLAT